MTKRGWACIAVAVALTACGNNNNPGTDSGPTPGTDSGSMTVELPLATADTDGDPTNGTEATADFSCVGSATAPTPGAAATITAHFYDFQTPSTSVANSMVEVWTTNVVGATCAAPDCMTYTTDAMGNVDIMAAMGGWVAYRVPAAGSFVTTIGYNRAAAESGSAMQLGLPVVGTGTIGLIPSLFARMRLPGTGVVSGNLSDCNGDTVEGAVLRLFRGDAEIQPGTGMTDFFVGYFGGASGLPDRRQMFTSANGIYASANVAATTDLVRVEVWAVTEEGGEPTRVACEAIQVAADAVSIISAGPTRSDYPSGHPCAD